MVGVEQGDVLAVEWSRAAQAPRSPAIMPLASQWRRHSCTSHSPITLRSSRVVPSIPRSLVRLNAAALRRRGSARRARGRAATRFPRRGSPISGALTGAAMNAEAVSCEATVQTGVPAIAPCWSGADCAEQAARSHRSSPEQIAAGSPSLAISIVRPAAGPGVEQAGRGGDRRLVGERAGQPQADQVGDQRHVLGGCQRRAVRLGEQLEDGVDRHRLDAGPRVELGRRRRGRRSSIIPSVRRSR